MKATPALVALQAPRHERRITTVGSRDCDAGHKAVCGPGTRISLTVGSLVLRTKTPAQASFERGTRLSDPTSDFLVLQSGTFRFDQLLHPLDERIHRN